MIDKRLFGEIKNHRFYHGVVVMNGIFSFMASFFQAFLIAKLVDNIFIRHDGFEGQTAWFGGILFVIIARALLQFLFEKQLRFEGLRIKTGLQQRAVKAMLKKGLNGMNQDSAGSKMMAVCEASDSIDPYFYEFIPQFITVVITVPLLLSAVLFLDYVSFLIMFFTAPLLPFFLALIGKASAKLNRSRMKSLQRLGGSFLDTLNGMKTLKLFGQSKAQAQSLYSASEAFRKSTMEVLRVSFLSAFVLELAATISTAVIAVSLGIRLIYGRMEFFDAFFILLLAPEYYLPIRQLGARFHTAMAAKAAADKIYEMTELKSDAYKSSRQLDSTPLIFSDAEVICRDVGFSYEKSKIPALSNIGLQLSPRKITALVGKSGSGKSTLAAALLRFVEIDSGVILFNGTNIKDIPVDSLRSMISYIPQKPFIFEDTVLENIRFSRPEATLEEVREAAGKAALEEFINNLPKGYDTILSEEGSSISMGEAQRIAIARAILKKAPLIIMDEGTSGLDERNEALLKKSFEGLRHERTVLIIAHRLNTVKNADRIYVMEEGKIADWGTHRQLMENCGLYRELIKVWEDDDETIG